MQNEMNEMNEIEGVTCETTGIPAPIVTTLEVREDNSVFIQVNDKQALWFWLNLRLPQSHSSHSSYSSDCKGRTFENKMSAPHISKVMMENDVFTVEVKDEKFNPEFFLKIQVTKKAWDQAKLFDSGTQTNKI